MAVRPSPHGRGFGDDHADASQSRTLGQPSRFRRAHLPFPILLLLFIFGTVRGLNLHPMHYFFLAAAFFSFHLLLAYLVDHLLIHYAFVLASAVSIFLVISYMRLILGTRLAFVEIGLGQFIYLVLFSYTFFFEGYTGLTITLLGIATLFAAMQFTARVDWNAVFEKKVVNGQ